MFLGKLLKVVNIYSRNSYTILHKHLLVPMDQEFTSSKIKKLQQHQQQRTSSVIMSLANSLDNVTNEIRLGRRLNCLAEKSMRARTKDRVFF